MSPGSFSEMSGVNCTNPGNSRPPGRHESSDLTLMFTCGPEHERLARIASVNTYSSRTLVKVTGCFPHFGKLAHVHGSSDVRERSLGLQGQLLIAYTYVLYGLNVRKISLHSNIFACVVLSSPCRCCNKHDK